jgi:hypothetical protein
MFSSTRRWLGALTATATMWPVGAGAQEVVRSFEELAGIAKAEETVVVTDGNGRRFKGDLTTIKADSISLATDGRILTFARSDVSAVRAVDGVANGVLIGAGAGLAAALGTLAIVGSGEGYVLPSAKAGVPLLLSGIGALVGGLIDRARGGRTLYLSRGRKSGLVVSPFVGANRQGVLVSVRF